LIFDATDVIRLIGGRCTDPLVQKDMRRWPFKVITSQGGSLQIEVQWKGKSSQFTPVEICSMILIQIKKNAETNLGVTITDAVVTVPVRFDYKQRHAIKEAGMIADLNFLQIISAPAANAMFYGTERLSRSSSMFGIARSIFISEPEEYNMIIFDLGAGTLDVAVVTIKENVCKVRATAGDIHLGGSDIDNNMVDYFVNSLNKRRADIRRIPIAISNLRIVCEKAKMSLSSDMMVPMKITPLYNNFNFESSITKAEFKDLNNTLLLKCIPIMEKCLSDARINIGAVHEIILAGGSARIPLLRYYIRHYFVSKELNISQHLETATAYGAASQAFFLSRRENERAHCLSLFDVTPFSLGLNSARGTMLVCVKKSTAIPIKIEKTIKFHSQLPSRSKFSLEVYEGEGGPTCNNNLLGKIDLVGTCISPNGNDIKVCFELHEDGTLTVMAEDISVGMRNGITITCNNIEDSKGRVWEALLYKESESSYTMVSTTKILTRSDTSSKWDQMRERGMLGKLLSMEKERSEGQTGQSSRQYVKPEEYAIGIDFGTTYSCVAVWRRNGVKIIENEYGSRLTCSAVAFTDTGRLIGDTVHKEQVTMDPANTIPSMSPITHSFFQL
jgi:heat shock 70kDa protein 1/2/6/8